MSGLRPDRPSGRWRRATPWFVASLVLALAALPVAEAIQVLPSAPAVGVGHPLSGNTTVAVNMTDTPRFIPKFLLGNVSSTLSVHLDNVGTYNHTFTVSRIPNYVLNTSWTPGELSGFFARNGSLANVSVAPGQQAWANISLNSSTSGKSFEFVSLVPYQFQAGMFGYLNVTVAGAGVRFSDNTTDSYSFVPSALALNSSTFPVKVSVLVMNTGSLGHTFTVGPVANYTLSPTNFTTYFQTHPPLVSATVPSGAGNTVWANFTIAGPGVFQYICTVSGHFANGMYGFIYVNVPVPAPAAPPSTAIVASWILLGSGVVLAIGILLVVVATYTGRFPRRPRGPGGHH